jgi:uncharacterized protein (DUF302 family)
MEYGYTKPVPGTFAEALGKTRAALSAEGFGVLTEIDVKSTLKKKLEVEFDNYVILGACNPTLAYQALQAEREVGLLLPCNVIVYEDDGTVYASAILPTVAMSMIDSPKLAPIAKKVEKKLKDVINQVSRS